MLPIPPGAAAQNTSTLRKAHEDDQFGPGGVYAVTAGVNPAGFGNV